ncbi:MAG: GNAT family N-acetyltransferase [Burkholderiaceae bacterium]|nr:GNAT family N-acetyltransferase [Burkholderiaceae bacterium]
MRKTIRLAKDADIARIFDIRTSVRENHLSRAQLNDMGITDDAIRHMIETEDCIWIAEVDAVPVGFAIADSVAGSVFAVFIRPQWEGLGLGRRLMNEAEAFLFEQFETIWLETDNRSRASGFYTRLGWRLEVMLEGDDVRFEKRRPPTCRGNC